MNFMKKILKLLLILVAIIIPGILIAGIAALFLVDTNHFKPQLIQMTEQKLGRKLVIDGDFSLQFYPDIAIKLTKTHLKNPEAFGALTNQDFAYVETVKLNIALVPLLKGKINIQELELDGLKLNLTRLAPNQDNWSDLVTNLKKASEDKDKDNDQPDNGDEEGNLAKGKFKLKLHETTIHKAELVYQDKPANKTYQLMNLNFYTEKVSPNKPINIQSDFNFIANKLSTKMALEGQMVFNPKESKLELSPINLKSTLNSAKLPGGKLVSDLSGTLKADWAKQTFNLQNITLKFNDSISKGSANIDFSSGLSVRFNLGINTLPIHKYLPDTHLTLNNIQTNGTFSNQILNLSSLKANLYKGNFQGSSKIHFKQQNQYQVNGKFNQVDIQALLISLKNINKISGSTNATLNLSTAGSSGAEIKRNLNGQVMLNLQQGYLYGFDVEYYLNQAQVLAKKLPKDTQLIDNKRTPFDQLTGNFIFKNGVISNQDLHGFAKFYDLTGAGNIDLVQEQIQYRLKAISLRTDGSKRKLPLAVVITGPFSKPKVAPDMDTYIQALVQDQLEKQINKQLERKLGITLPGSESTNSETGTPNGSSSTDKKALQKELINQGLQKLFGK
jgi:uncharacterized protein involved in outer membrane biogenesis